MFKSTKLCIFTKGKIVWILQGQDVVDGAGERTRGKFDAGDVDADDCANASAELREEEGIEEDGNDDDRFLRPETTSAYVGLCGLWMMILKQLHSIGFRQHITTSQSDISPSISTKRCFMGIMMGFDE